jgi:hypothetical protein
MDPLPPGVNVNRFMEIACAGDESLLEYSMLAVRLWAFHSRQQGRIPSVKARRDGACCNLEVHGVDTLDTNTIQMLIDQIPEFGEKCTDILLDSDTRSVTYVLSPGSCKGLGHMKPELAANDNDIVLELTCSLTKQQRLRVTQIKNIIAGSDARIDDADFQLRNSDGTDVLYISTFHSVSARLMMALAQDHVAGVQAAQATPVGGNRFQLELTFEVATEDVEPSMWSRVTSLFRRKGNRAARRLSQY